MGKQTRAVQKNYIRPGQGGAAERLAFNAYSPLSQGVIKQNSSCYRNVQTVGNSVHGQINRLNVCSAPGGCQAVRFRADDNSARLTVIGGRVFNSPVDNRGENNDSLFRQPVDRSLRRRFNNGYGKNRSQRGSNGVGIVQIRLAIRQN